MVLYICMNNKKNSIHDFDKIVLNAQNALAKAPISKLNKGLILDFIDECYKNGIGKARISKCLISLKLISIEINKDLNKVVKKDIVTFLVANEKKNYSEWTKQNYKVMIKKFYNWLSKFENNKEFALLVEDIKTTIPKNKKKLPEDLLTEEEILKLVNSMQNFRDKALISLLYESGARVDEVGSMTLRDLIFDEDGVIVILDGKTGMRRIRIVSSEVLLKKYLEQRAGSKSLESPLWTKEAGTQLSYGAIAKLIRVGVANAGIKKHVHPHLFRHSRATFLASRLTEAQMNNYLGWTQGSGMAKTYVHLSGKDVDNAILAMHGKREKQKINESKLVQIKCKRCMEVNPIGASYCIKCGAPLSVEIMLKYENKRKEKDDVMNMLLNDSDIKELIIQKLKGMSND